MIFEKKIIKSHDEVAHDHKILQSQIDHNF